MEKYLIKKNKIHTNMIKLTTYSIKGSDDFELDLPRTSELTYHLAQNHDLEPDGIIFIIPGFGNDANLDYQKNIIKYIAKEYNLLAIFVEYHSCFNRQENGAHLEFNDFDLNIFNEILDRYDIDLKSDRLSFYEKLEILNTYIDNEKLKNPDFKNYRENIFATLMPKKNEYQNFGILQSLDILTVLYHIKSLGYKDIISKKPIIAVGSSHGGYIANLLMKFAPNTFDVIIENSGYIKPPLRYIIGQETDTRMAECLSTYKESILIHSFTYTKWSTNKKSPYYFSSSAYEIRDLSNKLHIQELSKHGNKTQIISYHSTEDQIASFTDKENYLNELSNCHFNISLHSVYSKDQIDGKFIKNLKHAMGMSNKELLKNTLPNILKNYTSSTTTDICKLSNIEYKTSNGNIYRFRFMKNNIEANLIKSEII